jgi:hypothetical protein
MLLCPGLTEGNSLPNTDNASAPDELADIVSRGESLNESGDDNENTAGTHANLSAGEVGDRTTEKEAPENGTNGVGGIDGAMTSLLGSPNHLTQFFEPWTELYTLAS